MKEETKEAIKLFGREDLLSDYGIQDTDTNIEVFLSVKDMIKYYKQCKEIERLNNIINELEKSKEKQINEYEILILKIERYLNCYQYFLETQEENNKKIANMIHEFSLGSDKEWMY